MYTDLETQVLAAAIQFFNYGDENEKYDNAVAFNVSDLKGVTGLSINTIKGVVGSLTKKGLFCEMWCGERSNKLEIGVTDAGIDAVLGVQ